MDVTIISGKNRKLAEWEILRSFLEVLNNNKTNLPLRKVGPVNGLDLPAFMRTEGRLSGCIFPGGRLSFNGLMQPVVLTTADH